MKEKKKKKKCKDIKFVPGINRFIYGCFFSQAIPAHPSGKGRLGARYVLRSKEEGVKNWNVTKHQRKGVGRSGRNEQHVMTLSVGKNTLFRNVGHVLPTDDNQQPSIPTTSTMPRRGSGISQGNAL